MTMHFILESNWNKYDLIHYLKGSPNPTVQKERKIILCMYNEQKGI